MADLPGAGNLVAAALTKLEEVQGKMEVAAVLDEEDTFSITLERPNGVVFGLAYRVNPKDEVFLTGVIPDSPGDFWNANCDLEKTLIAGDRFLTVNGKTDPKEMVDELKTQQKVAIAFIKMGPRWHINGITAESMERVFKAQDKGLAFELQQPETMGEEKVEEPSLSFLQWIMIFCIIGLPNLFLVILFSDVGVGFNIYKLFAPKNRNMVGNGLVFLSTVGATFLYIADWTSWKSKQQKGLTAVLVVYGTMIGAFFKMRFYPQIPLVAALFHVPVFVGLMRFTVLRNTKRMSFYTGVGINLFIWGVVILLLWLGWMFTGTEGENGWKGKHTWTDANKATLILDAEPIYKEWKFKVGGTERRTFYHMDCGSKTRTDRVCSRDLCKKRGNDAFNFGFGSEQILQGLTEKPRGLYCCTKSGSCQASETDCSVPLIQTYVTLDDNIWCCDPDSKLSSDEKFEQADCCAKAKTTWFLVWIAPFVASFVNLLLGIFAIGNGVYLNTSDSSRLEKTLKQFVLLVCVLLLMMWVSIAIAGASMRLTGTLMAFCATGLVCLFIWVYLEIGTRAITIGIRGSRLMQSLIGLATNDWVRAMMLIGLNMLIPTALLVNMANQSARRMRGVTRTESRFTEGMTYVLTNVNNWNWANILIKVCYLCLLYWLMSIGVAKLTSVFLSWLNAQLLKIDFIAVVIVFFCIGFTMFLAPPVPGLPVYMSSGIVLATRARDLPMGFGGGTLVAVFLSFFLKLTACAGQYMIGYGMGKSVKIQQAVGVDKVFTRAIQQILEKSGIPLSKVSVLVGGPDWPTSVLCGILKLNLCQVLLGTCPVIFVSTPVVLSGAFMAGPSASTNEKAESGIFETLTPVMIGVAFLSQLASAVIAVYYIQEVIYKDGKELAKPRKEHEPVALLTKAEAEFVQAYNDCLQWNKLTSTEKGPLLVATGALMFSNFCFVFMDEACFRPFKVTGKINDSFDKQGLDGNALNIIKLPGILAHILFIIATGMFISFLYRAKGMAQRQLIENRKILDKAIAQGTIASASEEKRVVAPPEEGAGGGGGAGAARKSRKSKAAGAQGGDDPKQSLMRASRKA